MEEYENQAQILIGKNKNERKRKGRRIETCIYFQKSALEKF